MTGISKRENTCVADIVANKALQMKNLLTAFFQCYDENVCFLDIKGIFPNVNGCRTPSVQGAKYCEILCAFFAS